MRPSKVAVVGDEERWTYGELDDRVARLAHALRAGLKLRQGERVALLSANGPEFLLVLMAVARCGLVLVPLNWRLTPFEQEYQLKDSGARRIFASAEYLAVAKDLSNRLSLPAPVRLNGGAETGPDDLLDLEELMAGEAEDKGDPEPLPWDLPLLIGYTSGTTGKPKGAVLTHANMFWNAMNDLLTIDLRSSDVSITLLPMFHIGGLGLFTLPTLLAGGRVIIPSRFEPEAALHQIERERVTIVFGVPTVHQRLLEAIDRLHPDLAAVRMFYSGGAPCPVDLIRAFQARRIPFGQGYGLTETSPTVFMLVEEDFNRKQGTIGRPAPFNRVRLVDPVSAAPVGPDQVGEIIAKGPNVFAYYWQNEEANRQAVQDGWFHTGDLAWADAEGFVTVAGRLKEMIISGGENVYPVEVEQVLQSHPQVVEAAVYGVADSQWGEVPHAAVVAAPESTPTEEELRAYCGTRLARYKVPKRIHLVSEFPRNAAGKVTKAELAARLSTSN